MRTRSSEQVIRTERPRIAGRAATLGASMWRWLTSRRALFVALAALLLSVSQTALDAGNLSGSAKQGFGEWVQSGSWLDLVTPGGQGEAGIQLFTRMLLALTGLVLATRLLALWVPGWALPPSDAALVRAGKGFGDQPAASLEAAGLRQTAIVQSGAERCSVIRDASPLRGAAGLAYLGVLVVLVAGAIQGRFGWAGAPVELALSEEQPLGDGASNLARLDQIALVANPDGSIRRVSAQLTVTRDGDQGTTVSVGSERPARLAGLTIAYTGRGPAVRVEAWGPDGTPLSLRAIGQGAAQSGTLRVRFPSAEQEQLVLAADADRLLSLVYYAPEAAAGSQGPVVRAQYREASTGRLLDETVLGQAGELQDERATVRLASEYYVRVRAGWEPGRPIAALGAVLVALGVAGGLVWPPRRAWTVRQEREDGARSELLAPRGGARRPWLHVLTDEWPADGAGGPCRGPSDDSTALKR